MIAKKHLADVSIGCSSPQGESEAESRNIVTLRGLRRPHDNWCLRCARAQLSASRVRVGVCSAPASSTPQFLVRGDPTIGKLEAIVTIKARGFVRMLSDSFMTSSMVRLARSTFVASQRMECLFVHAC